MSPRTESFDAELAELIELDRRAAEVDALSDGASDEVASGDDPAASDDVASTGDAGLDEIAAPGRRLPATRLGRFTLLELLGEGGMGSVYAAYDPSLDRKVALKLVRYARQTPVSRERMTREARALARLSHPNVVAVHEVGTFADQLFLVMEFVHGQTLEEWLEGTSPDWRAVVDAFVQGARGLAAAHDAGLIHRDVKPGNLVIGEDGRVRLIDFGLARADEPDSAAEGGESAGAAAPLPGLTATGARLGTPGYMAPEQITGGALGPATDQFALCVALWEALYGARPFADETLEGQLAQMTRGDLAAPAGTRSVPKHVDVALRRGLACEPAARFPSLDDLVVAITRDPARQRRRVGVAALGLVGALGLGAVGALGMDAGPGCEVGDRELAQLWNTDSRAAAGAAIGALPGGESVWQLVEPRLDAYATRWRLAHRDACEAHRDRVQSDRLFDARMRCLDRRYAQLGAAVELLRQPRRGGDTVDAPQLVAGLEPVAACSDLEALAADVAPPASSAQRDAVERVEAKLDQNAATAAAGFFTEAFATGQTLAAEAEATGYGPVVAEANLQVGRAAIRSMRAAESVGPLERSRAAAVEAGAADIAAEAQVRLVWSLANLGRWDADDLERGARLTEALVASATPPPGLPALMDKNLGESYRAVGDQQKAQERLARSLDRRPAPTATRYATELASAPESLSLGEPRPERQVALLQQSLTELTELVGENHVMTLRALCRLGEYVENADAARANLERGVRGLRAYVPDAASVRGDCEIIAAGAAADLGQNQRAKALFDSAAALYAQVGFEVRAKRAEGASALLAGRPADALVAFERSIKLYRGYEPEDRWWIRREMADAQIGAGSANLALGAPERSLDRLSQAIQTLERMPALAARGWTLVLLARARVAYAQAAIDLGREARAREALAAAERWYRDHAGNSEALARIDDLRRRLQ